MLQDYCGLLSEDAVRKNFVLVYELLDEVIDYGYPQNSSSEALKELVHNEPTIVKPPVSLHLSQGAPAACLLQRASRTMPSYSYGGREFFATIVSGPKVIPTLLMGRTLSCDGSVQMLRLLRRFWHWM